MSTIMKGTLNFDPTFEVLHNCNNISSMDSMEEYKSYEVSVRCAELEIAMEQTDNAILFL